MIYLSDEDIQSVGIATGKCIKYMLKVIQSSCLFVFLKTKAYFQNSQERLDHKSSHVRPVNNLYNAFGTGQYCRDAIS